MYADRPGGQELILLEVYACLEWPVYFPLPELCDTLLAFVQAGSSQHVTDDISKAASVYMGTPTIVSGRPLFPHGASADWSKADERAFVRGVVKSAEATSRCKRIVTGLGTGDVLPHERIEDMGGGSVVCSKSFGDFGDFVIVRDLPVKP